MFDIFTGSLAQILAGTLGPPLIAFSAGLVVVGVIAGLKRKGWKGLAIALGMLIGIIIVTLLGLNVGRESLDSETQAVLDSGIATNSGLLLPWGFGAGVVAILVLGLPILFSPGTRD